MLAPSQNQNTTNEMLNVPVMDQHRIVTATMKTFQYIYLVFLYVGNKMEMPTELSQNE